MAQDEPGRPVRTRRIDGVFVVTIDRPEVRNAVDRPTADALVAAFEDFEAADDVDVAVLTGSNRTFCAGADLRAIGSGDPERINRIERSFSAPMGPTRWRTSKPVIAAIEGHAVAGGLELALWCDLRVVAQTAVLGVFCRRWGVPFIDGGTIRLARLIGQSRATDLILTGRPVAADEALAIGLANRTCPPGQALEQAIQLAQSLRAFPQACLRADLAGVRTAFDADEPTLLLGEHDRGVGSMADGEMLAGVARFVDGAGRHGEAAVAPPGPA